MVTKAQMRSGGSNITIAPVSYPRPVAEVAISPRTHHDEEKLSTALHRILDEDPTLRVDRKPETGETVLAGLGDVHLDVTLARIHRKFGVEVGTAVPKVPYRETITSIADAEGKHKKQTGGRGQFGVANVKFSPLPRGSGYEFIDAVKGGAIPRQFIPAVNKGIQEALARGILAGYPVVDVAAEVFDGKFHNVDSDELSFRMAGIQAFRAAAPDLRPVLLEPIMHLTIRVPDDHTGDVMGDINSKRGRVLGIDSDGGSRVSSAEIPMVEIQHYAADLRSMTSGRGTFEVRFDHYAEVPHQEAQKVISAAGPDKAKLMADATLRFGDKEVTLPVVRGDGIGDWTRHLPAFGGNRPLHSRSGLWQHRRERKQHQLHRRRQRHPALSGLPNRPIGRTSFFSRSGLSPFIWRTPRSIGADQARGFRSPGTRCCART